MGFTTDKIPYSLEFGLDLSYYNESKEFFHSNTMYELIRKLEEFKVDFVISNVSVKDHDLRHQAINQYIASYPVFLNDSFLFSYEWKNKFRGKLHDVDLTSIKENSQLIKIDLDYCNHISSKYIVSNLIPNVVEDPLDNFLFCKLIKKFFNENPDKQIYITVELSKEGLENLKVIQSQLGYNDNLGVILKINPNLPELVIEIIY